MPYFLIEHFSAGLDLRKINVTARPGSLRSLQNAFINVGGEIEKRKTITSVGVLPAGQTKGLAFQGDELVVFGTLAAGPDLGSMPDYVRYRQLIPTDPALTLVDVLDVSPYSDKLYVIARMSDGEVHHFDVTGPTGTEVTQTGTNARTHKGKTYIVDGKNLRFSAVNTMSDFTGTGSGLIDATSQDAGSTDLVGIEQYYSYLALFARTSIQIWAMDPDPASNSLVQVLGNIGLVAPNAVAQYGNGDTLFLSHTGLRSLRARDASNAAVLNDIGSPIDPLIAAKRRTLNDADSYKIRALVDPLTGQFWLIWGADILVLAYYPNSKISAWGVFQLNIPVDAAVVANSRIAVRSGEELFIYGTVPAGMSPWAPNAPVGTDPAEYDATVAEAITPYLDVGKPATVKKWQGLDLACEGTWTVEVNYTPEFPDLWTLVATIQNSTYSLGRIPFENMSTHIAVRLRSQGTGPAKVGAVTLHFEGGDEG